MVDIVYPLPVGRLLYCTHLHIGALHTKHDNSIASTLLQRRHVSTPAKKLLATARAVTVSSGGQAVSQSLAAGKNAVSSSQANSSGNGAALSVSIADGTSTVANASASATGEQRTLSFTGL